jgi:hypothetical protein
VRRIQNRSLSRKFNAELKSLEVKLGKRAVDLTQRYAWHGSGKTRPDEIAAEAGVGGQILLRGLEVGGQTLL